MPFSFSDFFILPILWYNGNIESPQRRYHVQKFMILRGADQLVCLLLFMAICARVKSNLDWFLASTWRATSHSIRKKYPRCTRIYQFNRWRIKRPWSSKSNDSIHRSSSVTVEDIQKGNLFTITTSRQVHQSQSHHLKFAMGGGAFKPH